MWTKNYKQNFLIETDLKPKFGVGRFQKKQFILKKLLKYLINYIFGTHEKKYDIYIWYKEIINYVNFNINLA